MNKKNQYLEAVIPHLEKKYGKDKAAAIIASAWYHFERLCMENANEPKAYDCCDFRMKVVK